MLSDDDKIKQLQEMIDESHNIVAFTGAGVSTDSGIKDFRSKDGLYSKKTKYPAEYMLSSDMFFKHTEEFYEYYKANFNTLNVLPNVTHQYLQKLEETGKLKAIITQNIDGLHTKAGSKNVLEIHGTIYDNHCLKCGKYYDGQYIFNSQGIPKCECGGIIKPDVTLYGETLPPAFMEAESYISKAYMLLVLGTSLKVKPASSLLSSFKGKYLVLINNDATTYDNQFDLVLNTPLKRVFKKLK